MKNFAFKQHSSRNRTSVNLSRVICYKFGYLRRESIGRFKIKNRVSRSAYRRDVGLAKSGRRLDESVEHGLQVERRAANDPEHVGRRSLLLQRLVALAGELGDMCFLAGSEVMATTCALWRIATRQRLVALRFNCFAARFVAPPHCSPQGSGQGIVATQTSAGKGPAMSALGQEQTCASQQAMSALPPKATLIAFFRISAKAQKRTGQLVARLYLFLF